MQFSTFSAEGGWVQIKLPAVKNTVIILSLSSF